MGAYAEFFQHNPSAACFGLMGLFCQLIWPLFRARKAILAAQFGIGADYAVHYALLGAWSGAGVAGLGATQTALALLAGERPWLSRAGVFFLPAVGAICLATWEGVASLFALTACALVIIGRLQRDTLRLRILLMAAAPFGIGYDLAVGALPALIGACVSACIAATMLAREIRARRGAPWPRRPGLAKPNDESSPRAARNACGDGSSSEAALVSSTTGSEIGRRTSRRSADAATAGACVGYFGSVLCRICRAETMVSLSRKLKFGIARTVNKRCARFSGTSRGKCKIIAPGALS